MIDGSNDNVAYVNPCICPAIIIRAGGNVVSVSRDKAEND